MVDERLSLRSSRAAFSIPSLLAIVCALVSFAAGAGWGFILAVAAVVLGIIGLLLAVAPGVRGGIISLVSIIAGALGIVAALFKLLF
jgi:hypothetical protein